MRRGSRAVTGLAAVAAGLAAVAGLASCGTSGASSPGSGASSPGRAAGSAASSLPSPGAPAVSIGTYSVATRTVTYVDKTRPTPPQGSYGGARTRTLVTSFYYPTYARGVYEAGQAPVYAGGSRLPLVVFAHGIGGAPSDYTELLTQWASAGFVIAAPRFPLSRSGAPGAPTFNVSDMNHQVGDMSFVIDRVLAEDSDPASWLYRAIDPSRIGAAGHSLGGVTVLGLVYNSCCRDARIRAAVSLAGAPTLVLGKWFATPGPPLLIIQGSHDETVAYDYGVETYRRASPPKYFLTVPGGTHSGPFQGSSAAETRVAASVAAFYDAYLDGHRGALAALRHDADDPPVVTLQQAPG